MLRFITLFLLRRLSRRYNNQIDYDVIQLIDACLKNNHTKIQYHAIKILKGSRSEVYKYSVKNADNFYFDDVS